MTMIFRHLSVQPYLPIWEAMKEFTLKRDKSTPDECWLLEHPPVYTQGIAGKPEHILDPANIPIVQSDRGGQVTYHGPGQILAYLMLDLRRRGIHVKALVTLIEETIILLLSEYHIKAYTKCKAPGVYVEDKKIASLGLRVKNGCSYHGLALNVDMDLRPFSNINPCGYASLQMTQLNDFVPNIHIADVVQNLQELLQKQFVHY